MCEAAPPAADSTGRRAVGSTRAILKKPAEPVVDTKKKVKKEPQIESLVEPPNYLEIIENIRRIRLKYPAPVDTMGCAQDMGEKTMGQRFQILVSLMLSSQTKDQITHAAVRNLREKALCTPDALSEAKEKDIEDLIYPVGFYRRKAVHLKKVAQIIRDDYSREIPDSIENLCKLPGVGPKMAHLCMQEAWGVNSGIGVDVHVHRIANRLGWVYSKGTKTPEDTRKALESWLPPEYWREINKLLVGFGQTICTPLRPKCTECYNASICPSSSVKAKTAGASRKSKDKAPASVTDARTTIKKEKVVIDTSKERKEEGEKEVKNSPSVVVKKERNDDVEEDLGEKEQQQQQQEDKTKRARPVRASERVSKRKR